MTRKSAFVVAATCSLAVVASACGRDSFIDAGEATATGAITDGRLGTQADVGATVSLYMFGDSGCTGTLVAPRVVATAAHCLEGVSTSDLEIVVSALVPSETAAADRLAVESLTPHPEYSFFGNPSDDPDGLSDDRDIGVVVLEEPAPIAPAPVVHAADIAARLSPERDVVIEGYGLTDFDGDGDYGRLYVATTPLVRRGISEFLAGRPGSPDTCNGDSGGPAYVEIDGVKHLAGITSRAALSSNAPCGDGGIYTTFGAFESFVEQASGGLYTAVGDDVELPPPGPGPEGAGSCEGACDDTSPDKSCFCDSFCEASGDCCDDFRAECPDVPEWTCSVEDIEDEECDCDCGAPDPACGADECQEAPPPPPPDDDDDDTEGNAIVAGDDDDEQPPGCAATGTTTPALLAFALLVVRRRRQK